MTNGLTEVDRLRARLESTFGRIDTIPEDPQIRSDFAKYLCVLASGYLERAIAELLISYADDRSEERVTRRLRAYLEYFQNPKKGRILDLIEGFDSAWKSELDEFIDDRRASAIGTVVAQRHRIAHGEDSSISFVQVREYMVPIDEVVEKITEMTK